MKIANISSFNTNNTYTENKYNNQIRKSEMSFDSISFSSKDKNTKKHPAIAKLLAFVTAISASISPYAKNTVYADDNKIAITTNENVSLIPNYEDNPDYLRHLNHKFDLKQALLEQGITMNKDGTINTNAYIHTIGVPQDAQKIIDAHNKKITSQGEIKTSEMVIIENKIYDLESEIKSKKSKIKKLNSEISENEKLYNNANKKTKKAKSNYSKALNAVKKKNSKINSYKKQIGVIDADLELNISEKSKRQELLRQKAQLEQKIAKLRKSKQKLVEKKDALKKIYDSKKKTSNSYLRKINAQKTLVERLNLEKQNCNNQINRLQKKLDKLESDLHPCILIENL